MWSKSPRTRSCERSKTICSARSTSSVVSPMRSWPSRDDLLPGPDQPAEGRGLLDDARVVLDVRGRRDERRELRDARGTADLLELAALLELVRERDRVDRLALRPKREARPVDRAVGAAVEVGRVEDLRHDADRGLGEEHRSEDGLLGLEILRWHLGRQGCMRGAHGEGSKPSGGGPVQKSLPAPTACLASRKNGTHVPMISPSPDTVLHRPPRTRPRRTAARSGIFGDPSTAAARGVD